MRRTIVVPLLGEPESGHALALACRLATAGRSRVLLLAPLVVEAELPLDAHFHEREAELHLELERARALAETYGISARTSIVRAREGQLGREVAATGPSLVVVGARNDARRGFRRPFSRDVWSILHDAPCRVMIATGIEAGRSAHARSAA